MHISNFIKYNVWSYDKNCVIFELIYINKYFEEIMRENAFFKFLPNNILKIKPIKILKLNLLILQDIIHESLKTI